MNTIAPFYGDFLRPSGETPMAVETHNEPAPREHLSAWEKYIPGDTYKETASSRWTSQFAVGTMVVCGVVLAFLSYAGSKKWFNDSTASASSLPPPVAISQPVEGELARSLREIEALKSVVSEQSGTNQQWAAALAALRSELQEIRQQLAVLRQAANQKSTSTTGSVNSRATKQARVGAPKQGQQPPLPLAAPNSR
jgi:hypothetical protein